MPSKRAEPRPQVPSKKDEGDVGARGVGLRVYRVAVLGLQGFQALVRLALRVAQGFGPEVENGGASVAAF